MKKLYRGVSVSMDEENEGRIVPKGNELAVIMKVGDKGLRADGKFQVGPTINNTARSHQLESGMHGGCAISTTRDFDRAKEFATSGGFEDGYIYEINEDFLSEYGVTVFDFIDPEYPHEKEVTLITKDCCELPSEVIVGKKAVKSAYST